MGWDEWSAFKDSLKSSQPSSFVQCITMTTVQHSYWVNHSLTHIEQVTKTNQTNPAARHWPTELFHFLNKKHNSAPINRTKELRGYTSQTSSVCISLLFGCRVKARWQSLHHYLLQHLTFQTYSKKHNWGTEPPKDTTRIFLTWLWVLVTSGLLVSIVVWMQRSHSPEITCLKNDKHNVEIVLGRGFTVI